MKKYLKDMNKDELRKIFDNNEKIKEISYEDAIEQNMIYQEELSNIFFGNNWCEYIELHDYYNSFYLKLKSAYKFFDSLNKKSYEYLNTEKTQEFKEIYKNANKYYININTRCNYGSDKYYKNIDKLEEECNKLLEMLESELHSLENVDEEDAFNTFLTDVDVNGLYDGLYISNNDYTHVYEHINYIKEW